MVDVKHARDEGLVLVLKFMNEDYLRSVPLHVGGFFANGPQGCRHWFIILIVWVLEWKESQGRSCQLPPWLNLHLRNYIWLDEGLPLIWWHELWNHCGSYYTAPAAVRGSLSWKLKAWGPKGERWKEDERGKEVTKRTSGPRAGKRVATRHRGRRIGRGVARERA